MLIFTSWKEHVLIMPSFGYIISISAVLCTRDYFSSSIVALMIEFALPPARSRYPADEMVATFRFHFFLPASLAALSGP
jgi:hypothetical protein